MIFNSINFLIFFPIVVFLYYAVPKKLRNVWLLAASYYFYMCWNAKYTLLLLLSTVITYGIASIIEKTKYKKFWLILCIVTNVGILVIFKYFTFLLYNINVVFRLLHIELLEPSFSLLLPVGISFYTFQSLSYTIDVYRGEITSEKSFIKYALFVSFFPQLVAGPIERSKHLLKQIQMGTEFSYENARDGLLLMLWGFFEKMAIADQTAVIVDEIFNHYENYSGASICFATILFSIQIYGDFCGYSHIAIGAAQVLGYNLMSNFRQPYFSVSIKDFWNRWHISLSIWLRDYIYIPLGGSRCSTIKKYRNLIITFLISGLWHGANWHYVLWGGIHGVYRIIGDATLTIRNRMKECVHLVDFPKLHNVLQQFITFFLVTLAWFMFRINGLRDGFQMLQKVLISFEGLGALREEVVHFGLNGIELVVLAISLLLLWGVDYLHEKNIHIRERIASQFVVCRWICYVISAFAVLILFLQDFGMEAANFIYFQF